MPILSVHGEAIGNLAVGGKIDVLHAEVGIPKGMPVQVPVLNVRVAGQPPPPPPAAAARDRRSTLPSPPVR